MYESLSEESKQGAKVAENAPLMKVYTSLLMSSFEQLMIVGKVGEGEGWKVGDDGGVRSAGGDAAGRQADEAAGFGGGVHEDEQL